MRHVTRPEADTYLTQIGMRIGDWNQLTDIDPRQHEARQWINYRAPADGRTLYTFSQYLSEWLPRGDWKLFTIDNSTSLDPAQSALIASLLPDRTRVSSPDDRRQYLFEFCQGADGNMFAELSICNLIFAMLMFEAHGQLVSSTGNGGHYLSIQDGFAYFLAKDLDRSGAKVMLSAFEREPQISPKWVQEIIGADQERMLATPQNGS